MLNKERDRVSFRLRQVDEDLRAATKGLPADKLSDLARDGLRLILGIRTTKSARIEITERPIIVKTEAPETLNTASNAPSDTKSTQQKPHTIPSKPAFFPQNQQRRLTK